MAVGQASMTLIPLLKKRIPTLNNKKGISTRPLLLFLIPLAALLDVLICSVEGETQRAFDEVKGVRLQMAHEMDVRLGVRGSGRDAQTLLHHRRANEAAQQKPGLVRTRSSENARGVLKREPSGDSSTSSVVRPGLKREPSIGEPARPIHKRELSSSSAGAGASAVSHAETLAEFADPVFSSLFRTTASSSLTASTPTVSHMVSQAPRVQRTESVRPLSLISADPYPISPSQAKELLAERQTRSRSRSVDGSHARRRVHTLPTIELSDSSNGSPETASKNPPQPPSKPSPAAPPSKTSSSKKSKVSFAPVSPVSDDESQ